MKVVAMQNKGSLSAIATQNFPIAKGGSLRAQRRTPTVSSQTHSLKGIPCHTPMRSTEESWYFSLCIVLASNTLTSSSTFQLLCSMFSVLENSKRCSETWPACKCRNSSYHPRCTKEVTKVILECEIYCSPSSLLRKYLNIFSLAANSKSRQ